MQVDSHVSCGHALISDPLKIKKVQEAELQAARAETQWVYQQNTKLERENHSLKEGMEREREYMRDRERRMMSNPYNDQRYAYAVNSNTY